MLRRVSMHSRIVPVFEDAEKVAVHQYPRALIAQGYLRELPATVEGVAAGMRLDGGRPLSYPFAPGKHTIPSFVALHRADSV